MKWLVVFKERLRSTQRMRKSKGCELPTKETWWQNEKIQAAMSLMNIIK